MHVRIPRSSVRRSSTCRILIGMGMEMAIISAAPDHVVTRRQIGRVRMIGTAAGDSAWLAARTVGWPHHVQPVALGRRGGRVARRGGWRQGYPRGHAKRSSRLRGLQRAPCIRKCSPCSPRGAANYAISPAACARSQWQASWNTRALPLVKHKVTVLNRRWSERSARWRPHRRMERAR